MTPTHLLIPIKDIEDINSADYHKRPFVLKTKIISLGKQISLNEEDINEAATDYAFGKGSDEDFHIAELYIVNGYIQALKDLLKH